MTREQYTEIVGTLLGYSDSDIRTHQQDIFFAGDAYRSSAIPAFLQAQGEVIPWAFVTTMFFDVQYNSQRGLQYIDLGTQFLALQDGTGIPNISLPKEIEESFVLQKPGMLSVYSGLEAGQALGKKICFREANIIYFLNLLAGQDKIALTGVPSLFAILGETEQIPQPAEFNGLLIEGTRAMFLEQKYMPEDKTNDSVPVKPMR
jgi:hypothetical protein